VVTVPVAKSTCTTEFAARANSWTGPTSGSAVAKTVIRLGRVAGAVAGVACALSAGALDGELEDERGDELGWAAGWPP
jgi:hypothetical protein